MSPYAQRYHLKSAAAWLRGHALKTGAPEIDPELLDKRVTFLNELAAGG